MDERQLLFSVTRKDLDITYFRGSGKGGQHRNKTDSACRIVHRDSGAMATAQENRSQLQNKHAAFRRLVETPKFKAWWRIRAGHVALDESLIAEAVAVMMHPSNLKEEVMNEDGEWVDVKD